jgi:uncharacterized protein HemX
MELVTLLAAIVSVLASAVGIYIALKKSKPEIKNTDSLTEKNKAEIVEIYAEEIRKLKDEQEKDSEKRDKKITFLEEQVVELNKKLNQQANERKQEQLLYREFINELLVGITKLTGQIQIKGETPVWVPPAKTPFDSE